MENRILIKAGMHRHRGSLAGIFILVFMISAALSTAAAVWTNAGHYVRTEMDRTGFGDLTAWVSKVPEIKELKSSIESLNEVEQVRTQELIFSKYEAAKEQSDSDGQLIRWNRSENRYRFFDGDLSGYRDPPDRIKPGQVYVSPSMVSVMEVQIGDKITFPIARNGKKISLTVSGYYEDPYMGSSMIGMKGFLVSQEDYSMIHGLIRDAGMNALARDGAMLHIQKKQGSKLSVSGLNQILNKETELPKYTEFIYSKDAVAGFMLILHNAFCGLFAAFAAVLLCAAALIMGHSISAVIEQEYVNMGILKTMGVTGKRLRWIQLIQYLTVIVPGMGAGLLAAIPLSKRVGGMTVTASGVLIPATLPVRFCIFCFLVILLLLAGSAAFKLRKISRVTPMKAIRGETEDSGKQPGIRFSIGAEGLKVRLALRQLYTGRRRYLGIVSVAVLLAFSVSLVGRMDTWLGPDGKGMMDAFNPAEHDIGVQALGRQEPEKVRETILSFTGIKDSYQLAMPDVSVNGRNYTANVITEPERFHILQGKTCTGGQEIVLTEAAASDLGVSIGDTLTVRGDKDSKNYRVSGIYQCANGMGNNIGMSREGYLSIGTDHRQLWCHHYFLEDPSLKPQITKALSAAYGGDVHVHENSWPGLWGIISAMKVLLVFMYGMTALFVSIVTAMTSGKILAAEKQDMGIFKSMGVSSRDLRLNFALRFGVTSAIGSAAGGLLAALGTDPVVSAVMRFAGISNFSSVWSVGNSLFPAAAVTLLFTGFAYLSAGKIKKTDMTVLITE
nr:FtsX-like permease family protein [uncultured Anaerostipes sp.]